MNFSRTRKVIEKRTRCESHVSMLRMYVAATSAPKGLQLKLQPATSEMSKENLSRWHNTLNRASVELTSILISHYESSEKGLRNQEKQLVQSSQFTTEELKTLELYRSQKLAELDAKKSKKVARDNLEKKECSRRGNILTTAEMRQPELESKSSGQDNIMNLSCYNLSTEERSVLSRGLNFCPATGGYSEFQLVKDLHNFERNMHLREYFYDRSSAHNTDSSSLPSYKHWTPPSQRDKCLYLYIRAV